MRDGARRYERWINGAVHPEDIERELFVECPIPHPTLVVRRDAYERVGGYRDGAWPEDYDLILRLWTHGYRMGKVPDELLHWRERPGRLSRTDPRYGPEAFRRLKARYLKHRIGDRPVVVCGAGPIGKAMARALREHDHRVVAFVDVDPRKIGQTVGGAPVIGHESLGAYRGAYAVAAVGSPGARGQIMASLRAAGFREPEDCCAAA